jgi:nucleoside-diphosphate-sugar epimerase
MDQQQHVLVTGGSGFIAGHCILQLLQEGHRVRTTIRSPGKEAAARRVLEQAGMVHGERLRFVVADLLHDKAGQMLLSASTRCFTSHRRCSPDPSPTKAI